MRYFFFLLALGMASASVECYEARGSSDQGISYSENRCRTYNQGLRKSDTVSYRLNESPKGELTWASKTVDYQKSPYLPAVHLSIPELNYELRTLPKSANEISIHLKSPKKNLTESLTVPSPAVLDAGIDMFIKDSIQVLMSGKTLEFNLVVPEFADWFRFEIEATSIKPNHLKLVMKPSSLFLSWFADPIEMTYSPQGELLDYSGISDIKDSSGKNIKVQLKFTSNNQNSSH